MSIANCQIEIQQGEFKNCDCPCINHEVVTEEGESVGKEACPAGGARSGVPTGRSPPSPPPPIPPIPIESSAFSVTLSMIASLLTYTYKPLPTTATDTAADATASTLITFCIFL